MKAERSFPVKRKSLLLSAVLFILAALGWAGWASYELRRQAAERFQVLAAQKDEKAAEAAGDALPSLSHFKGKTAPAFTLEDLSGRKVSLASYRGKGVLINFWATWCAPCKIETPWLVELRNRYAAQGFEVLGISADDLDRDDAKRLAEEKKQIERSAQQMRIPYPVLIDGASLSKDYGGLDSLPASFFVDRNGKVVAVLLGLTSKDEIEGKIRMALGH
jgi:cytochrome c biogenesis protein CcmG/thiol:disulfide interchange protein DsbE